MEYQGFSGKGMESSHHTRRKIKDKSELTLAEAKLSAFPKTIVEHATPTSSRETERARAQFQSASLESAPSQLVSRHEKREHRRHRTETLHAIALETDGEPPAAKMYLRPAEETDAAQIAHIYEHYVQHSVTCPTIGLPLDPDLINLWTERIRQAKSDCNPFLVGIPIVDSERYKGFKDRRNLRRSKEECIVGFARAKNVGSGRDTFRYTVELEIYVRDEYRHQRFGRALMDRMLAALSPGYRFEDLSPLIVKSNDDHMSWRDGAFKRVKVILVSLLRGTEDAAIDARKAWFSRYDFKECGYIARMGHKLGQE